MGLDYDQMEHLKGEQQCQYPMERKPNTYRSMRDYINPPWVSAPSYMVPPATTPYGSTYNPSWGNHHNSLRESRTPQYTPLAPPYYASTPQPPQPPQLSSLVGQAILNLSKLVDTFIEEERAVNVQVNQKIDTVESSPDKRIDGLQSKIDQKFDNLQKSISRLTSQQHVHQEEVSLEEECLIDTTVEEQCKQQNEAISPLLTEESSGKETGEEPQKLILQPIPINLDPIATVQPKNNPLPVHIFPTPAPHVTPETPTIKAIPSPLLVLQNFKKLVASVQTFATTSKTLLAAHVAWHSGWFGYWFRHEAPGP